MAAESMFSSTGCGYRTSRVVWLRRAPSRRLGVGNRPHPSNWRYCVSIRMRTNAIRGEGRMQRCQPTARPDRSASRRNVWGRVSIELSVGNLSNCSLLRVLNEFARVQPVLFDFVSDVDADSIGSDPITSIVPLATPKRLITRIEAHDLVIETRTSANRAAAKSGCSASSINGW